MPSWPYAPVSHGRVLNNGFGGCKLEYNPICEAAISSDAHNGHHRYTSDEILMEAKLAFYLVIWICRNKGIKDGVRTFFWAYRIFFGLVSKGGKFKKNGRVFWIWCNLYFASGTDYEPAKLPYKCDTLFLFRVGQKVEKGRAIFITTELRKNGRK